MSDSSADGKRVVRLIRTARLLLSHGGRLESQGSSAPIGQNELTLALEEYVRDSGMAAATDPKFVATEVLSHVKSALDKSAEEETSSQLSDAEWASLEAIVQVTGRPALGYRDGQVEMPNDAGENQHWAVLIATARTNINRVSRSVGRVTRTSGSSNELVGTAWRIGESLVVTNRHVAKLLNFRASDPVTFWKLDTRNEARVYFDADTSVGFAVSEIAYCSSDEGIDFAVLQLDCTANTPPAPLVIDWVPESVGVEIIEPGEEKPKFKGKEIYVVGHPYRRVATNLVAKIFGNADGSKRFSPGYVMSVEGSHLEHDCSTLGGNSGSCILTPGKHAVVGLHCGSREVDVSSARGGTNVALAFSRLREPRATEILRSGRL